MIVARIVYTILATIACLAFALSNTQHVEVSFVIGEPVETRLIFVLVISFGLGVLTSSYYRMAQDAKRHLKQRKMRQLRLTKGAPKEFEHE